MRQPSTPAERWSWWEQAVAGEAPPVHEDEVHAGFFAVRKFRYGEWVGSPFVPARIWCEPGEIDPETGELLSDERWYAEIDGRPANPLRTWQWMARRPISEAEWRWLRAMSPIRPTKIPAKPR